MIVNGKVKFPKKAKKVTHLCFKRLDRNSHLDKTEIQKWMEDSFAEMRPVCLHRACFSKHGFAH